MKVTSGLIVRSVLLYCRIMSYCSGVVNFPSMMRTQTYSLVEVIFYKVTLFLNDKHLTVS